MTAALLPLPLRTPIVDGEAIDSWIEALSRRNKTNPREVLHALGIDYPSQTANSLIDFTSPASLRRIEVATGLPPARLDEATTTAVGAAARLRAGGTRYCPVCFIQQPGRWLLIWRLKWSVACLRHRVLLHDLCPGCGTAPRRGLITATQTKIPPGICWNIIDRDHRIRCSTDFSIAPVIAAAPQAVDAQTWIEQLLYDQHHGPDSAHASGVLSDLHAVCSWLLSNDQATMTAVADQINPGRVPLRNDRDSSAGDAALIAATLTRAHEILGPDDNAAVSSIRSLLATSGLAKRIPPPKMRPPIWRSATPRFQNRYLRAADSDLPPTERLRLGTTLVTARLPREQASDRTAMIPQLIWPDWAARLLPAAGHWADLHRAAMSACLLIPGHPERNQAEDIARFNARIRRPSLSIPFYGLNKYPEVHPEWWTRGLQISGDSGSK
ncbi:TniQ family protein [Nocardia nova]|uniref:TniQ domain-containing protein n=1 Tax=Nocardia nova TaxID=37330 RepID=A0A2S6A3S7_9NOCA|nr:TniQ family protein [Nocardia nova]PPJ26493.1 hypothetical protein C5F51_20330 [Nocardia nova]